MRGYSKQISDLDGAKDFVIKANLRRRLLAHDVQGAINIGVYGEASKRAAALVPNNSTKLRDIFHLSA